MRACVHASANKCKHARVPRGRACELGVLAGRRQHQHRLDEEQRSHIWAELQLAMCEASAAPEGEPLNFSEPGQIEAAS